MQEIYNEGRVVGYSGYELYVKHHMSEDPNTPPLTERQWLSHNLGSGLACIIKLDNDSLLKEQDGYAIYQIPIPGNSLLYAASTIIGSCFIGDAYFVGNNKFAKYVISYGALLNNDSTSSPTDDSKPIADSVVISAEQQSSLRGYGTIIDGIVFPERGWMASGVEKPAKDCAPDVSASESSRATIRILTKEKLTAPVYLLLTGFAMSSGLLGVASTDGSINTPAPENGDFLGPEILPWATKIIFSIPSAYMDGRTYVDKDGRNIYTTHVNLGDQHTKSVSLQDDNGNDLPVTDRQTFDSNSPELGDKPLTWNLLLAMLASDRGCDLLGKMLRLFRGNLPNIDTTNLGKGVLRLTGTGDSYVGGKLKSGDGYPIKSGTQYIEFKDGLRLYISSSEPHDSDVPIGSIGIGW